MKRTVLAALVIFYGVVFTMAEELIITVPQNNQFPLAGRTYTLEYASTADDDARQSSLQRSGNLCWGWEKGRARAYDALSGEELLSFAAPYPVCALSPNGQKALLQQEKQLSILTIQSGSIVPVKRGDLTAEDDFTQWRFTSDGRTAVATVSFARGMGVLDVEELRLECFPLEEEKCLWQLQGILDETGRLGYFAGRRYTPEHTASHSLLVFDLENRRLCKRQQFQGPAPQPLAWNAQAELFYAASDDGVALMNPQTLTVVKKNDTLSRIHWLGLAPRTGELYVLTSFDGLRILHPQTLETIAAYRVGRSINAYTLGVTFAANGALACVTTPYEATFSIIDTASRKILGTVQIRPACGVFLSPTATDSASPWRALVFSTFLPYE